MPMVPLYHPYFQHASAMPNITATSVSTSTSASNLRMTPDEGVNSQTTKSWSNESDDQTPTGGRYSHLDNIPRDYKVKNGQSPYYKLSLFQPRGENYVEKVVVL